MRAFAAASADTRVSLHTQAMQAHRGAWRDRRVSVPAVAVLATCAALLPTAGGFAPRVVAAPCGACGGALARLTLGTPGGRGVREPMRPHGHLRGPARRKMVRWSLVSVQGAPRRSPASTDVRRARAAGPAAARAGSAPSMQWRRLAVGAAVTRTVAVLLAAEGQAGAGDPGGPAAAAAGGRGGEEPGAAEGKVASRGLAKKLKAAGMGSRLGASRPANTSTARNSAGAGTDTHLTDTGALRPANTSAGRHSAGAGTAPAAGGAGAGGAAAAGGGGAKSKIEKVAGTVTLSAADQEQALEKKRLLAEKAEEGGVPSALKKEVAEGRYLSSLYRCVGDGRHLSR